MLSKRSRSLGAWNVTNKNNQNGRVTKGVNFSTMIIAVFLMRSIKYEDLRSCRCKNLMSLCPREYSDSSRKNNSIHCDDSEPLVLAFYHIEQKGRDDKETGCSDGIQYPDK